MFACAQMQARFIPFQDAGFAIRPGIVDLHGDSFERHVAPRRGVLKNLEEGFIALDNELATNGITTAILPQFFSWQGGMRSPWFAEKFVTTLAKMRNILRTDMRVQLRLEMSMIDEFNNAEALIVRENIPYVVFNDNLPYRALASDDVEIKLTRQALRFGMEPHAYSQKIKKLALRQKNIPKAINALAKRLYAKKIILGYHDAKSLDAKELCLASGIYMAEFPQTLATAKAAFNAGCCVILGAPNVVRGASHYKKLKALAAIEAGYCTALASDYHYPSLRLAGLKLASLIGEKQAWSLISRAPAKCFGLDDRGALKEGMRADLTILNTKGRVVATMVAGRWSFLTDDVIKCLWQSV